MKTTIIIAFLVVFTIAFAFAQIFSSMYKEEMEAEGKVQNSLPITNNRPLHHALPRPRLIVTPRLYGEYLVRSGKNKANAIASKIRSKSLK